MISFKEYRDAIDSIAKQVLDEVHGSSDDDRDVYDVACEIVDGHQFVIYYAYNDDVLGHSPNLDAWEDLYSMEDIGSLVTDHGMKGARSVQAYFAMLQDVMEELQDLKEV